jgi:ppGpp synthetase/RelA/SpoT-type nucleotidyltranferase
MTEAAARDAARVRYIQEYPHFEAAADQLRRRLEGLTKDQGVADARVKARAKEIASFVKKLRKYGDDCWERTTDKVGAQIVTHTLAELRQLRACLEAGVYGLQYLETTDKSIYTGDPRELRYAGVHIQIRLAEQATSDGQPVECEIQLRTQAQDVWAYLEHSLIYKPVISPSPEIARKIARLSVLVEMFDEEVDTVLGQLERDPHYTSALLLHEAERWFLTFVSDPGEPDLSIEVIDVVRGSFEADEPATYGPRLADFVATYRDRIEDALHEYGIGSAYANEFNYFLFTQPEALIIWERVQNHPRALARAVLGTELASAVEALADVWGHSLTTE